MASTYTVERMCVIAAPADVIYPLIADFHAWESWSPWRDVDPDLERTYSGAQAGPGAVYAWSGNRKAGSGRMEITDVEPERRVTVALDFLKPFKSSNVTTFHLRPTDAGTEVRWTMEGPRPLVMRLMGPLLNMDKLVGRDFEKGLADLSVSARARGDA